MANEEEQEVVETLADGKIEIVGVSRITSGQYKGGDFSEVIFKDSNLKSIDDEAFCDCANLEYIEIPDGVLQIGDRAFAGCAKLQYAKIPESVALIGEKVFANCGPQLTIVGKAGTTAEELAKKHGLTLAGNVQRAKHEVKKKEDVEKVKQAVETRTFDIFGEKVTCSNTLPLYLSVLRYYEDRREKLFEKALGTLPKSAFDTITKPNVAFLDQELEATIERLERYNVKPPKALFDLCSVNAKQQYLQVANELLENMTGLMNAYKHEVDMKNIDLKYEAESKVTGMGTVYVGGSVLQGIAHDIDDARWREQQRREANAEWERKLNAFMAEKKEEYNRKYERFFLTIKPAIRSATDDIIAQLRDNELKQLTIAGLLEANVAEGLNEAKSDKLIEPLGDEGDNRIAVGMALRQNPCNLKAMIYATVQQYESADLNALIDFMQKRKDVEKGVAEDRKKRSSDIGAKILNVANAAEGLEYVLQQEKYLQKSDVLNLIGQVADRNSRLIKSFLTPDAAHTIEDVQQYADTKVKTIITPEMWDRLLAYDVRPVAESKYIPATAVESLDALVAFVAETVQQFIGSKEDEYVAAMGQFTTAKKNKDLKVAIDNFTALGNYKDAADKKLEAQKHIKANNKRTAITIVCVIAAVIVAIGAALGAIAITHKMEDDKYPGVTMTVEGDEAIVSRYSGSSSTVEIPSVYRNKPVTKLAENCFERANVSTIVIPDTVTTIGQGAFSQSNIETIVIPESVTVIPCNAFWKCSNLVSVTLPSTLITIENSAFQGCYKLQSLIIPDSVTYIGDSAFFGCSALTAIVIPENVTSISEYSFANCSNLSSVTMGDRVKTIGSRAFMECAKLTSITIPASVTEIAYGAFKKCGLTSLAIPDGVTTIESGAFCDCSSLESITIPFVGGSKGATSASSSTLFGYIFGTKNYGTEQYYSKYSSSSFDIPSSLRTVTVTGGDIFYGAFYGCDNLTTITIPESVTTIPEYAFYFCSNLTTVNIPKGVTSIGDYAFEYCRELTSITIPKGVTSIESHTFVNCSGLSIIKVANGNTKYHSAGNCVIETATDTLVMGCKSSVIPTDGSVTTIGAEAFKGNSSLTSIIIPDSVTSIESGAFNGCSSLESITIPFVGGSKGATSASSSTLFGYIFGTAQYTGGSSTTQYAGSTSVEYYIPKSLRTVTVTGGNIYDGAFYGCNNLTTINIPEGVTTIRSKTFYDCYGLTSFNIPNSVTFIGSEAFYYCRGLTSITLPNSIDTISSGAFYGCSGLTSITIPSSLKTIGKTVFKLCTRLTSVTIPASVTSFGSKAFEYCSALKNIYYDGTKTKWNAIRTDISWNYNTGKYTVHCTDGDIVK